MDEGWGLLIMIAALAAITLGPMVHRVGSPVPPDDVAAIRRFLETRGERLTGIRKLVMGGPWDTVNRRPTQRGRPYEVLSLGPDGERRLHRLAADGRDSQGGVALKRREGGDWVAVSE